MRLAQVVAAWRGECGRAGGRLLFVLRMRHFSTFVFEMAKLAAGMDHGRTAFGHWGGFVDQVGVRMGISRGCV